MLTGRNSSRRPKPFYGDYDAERSDLPDILIAPIPFNQRDPQIAYLNGWPMAIRYPADNGKVANLVSIVIKGAEVGNQTARGRDVRLALENAIAESLYLSRVSRQPIREAVLVISVFRFYTYSIVFGIYLIAVTGYSKLEFDFTALFDFAAERVQCGFDLGARRKKYRLAFSASWNHVIQVR